MTDDVLVITGVSPDMLKGLVLLGLSFFVGRLSKRQLDPERLLRSLARDKAWARLPSERGLESKKLLEGTVRSSLIEGYLKIGHCTVEVPPTLRGELRPDDYVFCVVTQTGTWLSPHFTLETLTRVTRRIETFTA